MKKLFLLAIVVLGFTMVSFAQSSVLISGVSTSVKIITPLAVEKTGDIVFGSVVPGASAGTVVLTADATPTRTPSGTIKCIGTFSNVKFHVTGEAGTTYSVSYPTSVSLTGGGGPAMTATLSCSASATANPIATADFYIGASLAIGTVAAQTAGNYAGTFDVTVAYE